MIPIIYSIYFYIRKGVKYLTSSMQFGPYEGGAIISSIF